MRRAYGERGMGNGKENNFSLAVTRDPFRGFSEKSA